MTWDKALIRIPVAAPLDLWLLHFAQKIDDDALSWLSVEERQRAARFRFTRDRHRYLLAHLAVRWLLAQRTGRPPATLQFMKSPLGKPRIGNAPDLRFSLSYARRMALIGLGNGNDVGVDIEQQQPVPDVSDLAEQLFTPTERAAVRNAATHDEKSLLFLRGWTRKEACLKAAGTGLRHPTRTIETNMDSAHATVRLSDSTLMEVASFTVKGHVASWARLL